MIVFYIYYFIWVPFFSEYLPVKVKHGYEKKSVSRFLKNPVLSLISSKLFKFFPYVESQQLCNYHCFHAQATTLCAKKMGGGDIFKTAPGPLSGPGRNA